jgi:hypothetical protein
MVGTNGKYFVTLDSGNVISYAVKSNGAIGKEVSSINLSPYSGGDCYSAGVQPPAKLDHTGRYLYILLLNSTCEAMQTFTISSTGLLTFKGGSGIDYGSGGPYVPFPTLTGNDLIGISVQVTPDTCWPIFAEFDRAAGGTLNFVGGVYGTGPLTQEPDWYYRPLGPITDDPTDHLAVAATQIEAPKFECGANGPTQLASYTALGESPWLVTSNTWQNMPTVPGGVSSMILDPTGKILAVATATGVQFFHFNGANPITTFTGIIPVSGSIVQMAWDYDGHLYALNTNHRMHVYAVTSKSAEETSGSRTDVPIGPFTVRSK